MLTPKRIFVVAAHPDDEVLGCGGTLAKMAEIGAETTIMYLGEGPLAREGAGQEAGRLAHVAARKAAGILGASHLIFADLPDNRLDALPLLEIVKAIEKAAEDCRPDWVLTHYGGDLNMDHVIAHRAALTVFRPLPRCPVRLFLCFETLSSTEYGPVEPGMTFTPSLYMDISGFLEIKRKALNAYSSELRPWPHPRSHEGVQCLAKMRGSQAGLDAAEAFAVERAIL